jgi:hypothetical protein
MVCGNSLRGVQKNWLLEQNNQEQTIPSYSIIREWLGRVGLYELSREKEKREDWLLITDLSIELGKEKCLVILGVKQEYYIQEVVANQRGLKHQDVEVLSIEIMTSTRGELINGAIEKVTKKVGKPLQIVSDHGSDLHKGVKLYLEKNPEVIHTYDVTHQMALLLKHQLEENKKYQSFLSQCHQCRQEIQQTELSYLRPPSQRAKSRFFNLDSLIDWGNATLFYEEKQDFSHIDARYVIDPETLTQLVFLLNTNELRKLKSLSVKNYDNREQLKSALLKLFAQKINSKKLEAIIQFAGLGRRRFLEKLGWLKEYKYSLIEWGKMLEITRIIETKLKKNGLHKQSFYEITKLIPHSDIPDNLASFHQKILDYLLKQTELIQGDNVFLATSDIIESLFGKYKSFSGRCALQELGRLILTIPLATMNFTVDLIKQALETITSLDVKFWEQQMFGQSSLSLRKMVFSSYRKSA